MRVTKCDFCGRMAEKAYEVHLTVTGIGVEGAEPVEVAGEGCGRCVDRLLGIMRPKKTKKRGPKPGGKKKGAKPGPKPGPKPGKKRGPKPKTEAKPEAKPAAKTPGKKRGPKPGSKKLKAAAILAPEKSKKATASPPPLDNLQLPGVPPRPDGL